MSSILFLAPMHVTCVDLEFTIAENINSVDCIHANELLLVFGMDLLFAIATQCIIVFFAQLNIVFLCIWHTA